MDKETLSHYGWIVILVLILAVLLALASPFGNFIAGAIKATTAGFFSVNQSALNAGGITIPGQEFPGEPADCAIEGHYNGDGRGTHGIAVTECNSGHTYTCECDSWIVPDGGTYTIASTGTVYNASEQLPCGYSPKIGDIYTNVNYEHRYNQYSTGNSWTNYASQNGWGVRCVNNVADPGPILENINGEPVTSMWCTFEGCTSLTTAPVIPNSVTAISWTFSKCTSLKTYVGSTDSDGDFSGYVIPSGVTLMTSTFSKCKSLTTAPVIPNSVTSMNATFSECTSLTTAPVIPNSVTNMHTTFFNCVLLKTYAGSTDPNGDFSGYVIPGNVTDMYATFSECRSLTTAPTIPGNVTNMGSTFSKCKSLTTAPVIPNSVTSMNATFSECTSLTTAPDMSNANSVTNMGSTFSECTSLVTAPVIPSSVTNMSRAFYGCTSLTGTITINATPTSYSSCLKKTQITEILGDCTIKDEILATK